jgi:(S)-ureidoglycine aminohydrolase
MGSGPQARFIHYLAHLEDGGQSGPSQPGVERFIFVLDGTVELKTERRSHLLESRNQGYALLPAGPHHPVVARGAARLNIFERYYLPYNPASTFLSATISPTTALRRPTSSPGRRAR